MIHAEIMHGSCKTRIHMNQTGTCKKNLNVQPCKCGGSIDTLTPLLKNWGVMNPLFPPRDAPGLSYNYIGYQKYQCLIMSLISNPNFT